MTLNNKQQVFVSEYLKCWNASEAARRAGYNGQANVVGPRLLANVSIKAQIDQRLQEMKMSADEVLTRLAEQARADMADFVRFQDGIKTPFLDLESANNKGLLRLVKKFKYNAAGHPEIELYDAQAALVHLGRAHNLFKETTTNLNLDLSQLTNEQLQRIAAGDDPASVLANPTQSGG